MTSAIVWFRRDLRLTDNPALSEALRVCESLVPLYIHAPEEEGNWALGSASRWWLHHSLVALDASVVSLVGNERNQKLSKLMLELGLIYRRRNLN